MTDEVDVKQFSVEVGGKEYLLVKTGRAQAEQMLKFGRWLSKHGMPAFSKVQESNNAKPEDGFAFLGAVLENLTVDALIDLFITVVGCSKEDAEVYFDIGILIDSLIIVYNEQPSVSKLVGRFFSGPTSQPE